MKVIIVEDERVTREGLEKLLMQIEGVDVVSKCTSARQGFAQIQEKRPDVVVTDIVMGNESGLDMIDWCRKADVQCEFVLVSGYSEFEYARRALQLNVFDYLNKPLDFSKMESIFARLKAKISNKRRIIDQSVDYFTGSIQQAQFEKSEILNDAELYVVAANIYKQVTCESDLVFGQQCFEQIAAARLKNYCRYIEKNGMHYELVSGKMDLDAFVSSLLSHVKSRGFKLGLDIRVGISRRFNDISAIGEGIWEATAAEQACVFQDKSIESAELLSYQIVAKPETLFMKEFIKMRDCLLMLDADEICNAAFGEINAMSEFNPPYVLFAFLRRCVREICWNMNEDKGSYVADEISDIISAAPSVENLYIRFSNIVKDQIARAQEVNVWDTDDVMGKVLHYIKLHYAEPMRAADVAQMFYMDSAYFSKRFKKAVGKNYNEYVTELRMNKAKQLLNLGGYAIAEVAQMVGYQSTRHFSKLFKTHTGDYPSDFREKKNKKPYLIYKLCTLHKIGTYNIIYM